jgi:hypothetical protein
LRRGVDQPSGLIHRLGASEGAGSETGTALMARASASGVALGVYCFGQRNLEIAGQLNGNEKLEMGDHELCESCSGHLIV